MEAIPLCLLLNKLRLFIRKQHTFVLYKSCLDMYFYFEQIVPLRVGLFYINCAFTYRYILKQIVTLYVGLFWYKLCYYT
jgi:hypothetical protein